MRNQYRIDKKTLAPLKWVLFDLDNTLWDFDRNAKEALKELFHRHNLELHTGYKVDQFIHLYEDINKAYWSKYEKGEVSKEVLRTRRFTDTFEQMGLSPALYPTSAWEEYLEICPIMTEMIPGALDALEIIKSKYSIGILTNGFEKTQSTKMRCSGIEPFVNYFQSSERIGIAKPSADFFKHALDNIGCDASEVVYIGDNWNTDVEGGLNVGIHTFHYVYGKTSKDKVNGYSTHQKFGGHIHEIADWANWIVTEN